MQKYKSKEVVEAVQYVKGADIKGVIIGKNDPTNRWDDTPDGPYVNSFGAKRKINEGDWLVYRPSFSATPDVFFLQVYSNEEFIKRYK